MSYPIHVDMDADNMSGSFTCCIPHPMHILNEMNRLHFGMAIAQYFRWGFIFEPGLVEVGKNAMKAHRCSWAIGGTVVLALFFCGAEQARATSLTIVDFEDQGLADNSHFNTANDIGVTSGGFYYTPVPGNSNPSGSNDLHIVKGNASFPSPFNGTTVGVTHDDVILTKEGDGTFSLLRFDFAGYPTNKEVSFKVTGVLADLPATTITQIFYLGALPGEVDGKVDGIGGNPDFQRFYLDSHIWTNLKSVTWTHTGPGTDDGRFALDNIAVNKYSALPEPSTITLVGLGILCLLGQGWFARKKLKPLRARVR